MECVLQYKTYEDIICTDLLEQEEMLEVKALLERDTLPISNTEKYNDYLDYYDLSECKDELIDSHLVCEDVYQPIYNPSLVFSILLEKADFTKQPERKITSNLMSEIYEWREQDSLPIEYSNTEKTNIEFMSFGKEEPSQEIREIPTHEETEPTQETSSNDLSEEITNETAYSRRYNIEQNMKLFDFSQNLLVSYFCSEMTRSVISFDGNHTTLFELDMVENTNNTFVEIDHKNNLDMIEDFFLHFQESFKNFISQVTCPKHTKEHWCLSHLEKEIEEERTSLFSSDSIINSDDIRTIPCPLLDARPKSIKIIPVEDIVKPKSTSNIEIALQNLWLSDAIYRSRKDVECFDGKNLISGLNMIDKSNETFEKEPVDGCKEIEMMLKIPNNMAPDSKIRIFTEGILRKISEVDDLENELHNEDMKFIGDLFQQTEIYFKTVNHYKDDGKGALYKYESLMETLVGIDEFSSYNQTANIDEAEQVHTITVQDYSPHLSPIEVKEHTNFNELLEDNLDAFLTFKKASFIPAIAQKEKEPKTAHEEEKLFLPEDIKISSKHSQMVKSILTQNTLVVLQSEELRIMEGLLILQKLKNCSSNSMFIHVDSDEVRLEEDFRFIRSFLLNHTRSLSLVTKDNFTTKVSNITHDCKILFISRCIAESFIQRMEVLLSKCCLIIYKELAMFEQDHFIPILKLVEGLYSISKKNIQTIIMSSIPSRDVSQLAHLLDATMSRQLLMDTYRSSSQKITVSVSSPISIFLESVAKVGEFTLSSVSGVKGYNFESMKFINLQSDFLKRIVEEFGTNLKVVLSSNDSRRIIETRSTFKKLVCLHTLKYLFEATLDGGLSVGRAYLEKIKETDTYRTLLDGAISDISFQIVKLSNEDEDYTKAQKVVLTAKEHYCGKSKILILSKHNKVLSNIVKSFGEGLNVFTLFNMDNKLYLKDISQGMETLFSDGLLKPEPHIYLTTFSNISHVSDERAFHSISLMIQVEPGDYNDVLYSLVCRNVIEHISILSKLNRKDSTLSLDSLNQTWISRLKRLIGKDSESIVNSKLIDQLLKKQVNLNILQDEDIGYIESLSNFFPKLKSDKKATRIIVTEKCIQNNDLLSELESRFSISVVERNSTLFSPADIVVNEKHCIIVYRFKEIESYREEITDLFNRILSLSLQFSYCWVIIENYLGGLVAIDSMSFMSSSLLCFTKSLQIEVNVRYSYNMDQSADIINSICVEVMSQSKSLNHDIVWVREKENSQEAFLSKFPCVNFYSAQAIVQNYSIKDICQMKSFEEFSQHLGRYFTETGLKLLYNVLFELFDGFEDHVIVKDVEDEQNRNDNVMDISQDNPSTFNNSFITQPDLSRSFVNEHNSFTFERPIVQNLENTSYQKRLYSTTQQDASGHQGSMFQPFKKTKFVDVSEVERVPSPLFQKNRSEGPPRDAFKSFEPLRMESAVSAFGGNNFSSLFGKSAIPVLPSPSYHHNMANHQQHYEHFVTPSRNPTLYQEQYCYQQSSPISHVNTWNNSVRIPNDFIPNKPVMNSIKFPPIPNPVKLQVPPSDKPPKTRIDFNAFKYRPSSRNRK